MQNGNALNEEDECIFDSSEFTLPKYALQPPTTWNRVAVLLQSNTYVGINRRSFLFASIKEHIVIQYNVANIKQST